MKSGRPFRCATLAGSPVAKLSTQTTWAPAPTNASHRCDPTKPAPPNTTARRNCRTPPLRAGHAGAVFRTTDRPAIGRSPASTPASNGRIGRGGDVLAATWLQEKRSRTRAAAAFPYAVRVDGSPSSCRRAAGQRSRVPGRNVQAGDAIDHGVEEPPDGGGHDRNAAGHRLQRHDAERFVPRRTDHDVGRPQQSRAADREAPARATARGRPPRTARRGPGSRATSGSLSMRACSGPPAMRSSASGSWAIASMASPKPLRGTSRPTAATRKRAPRRPYARSSTSGRVVKRSRSTPHGTTDTRPGSAPRAMSSATSSRQVAITWSAVRASPRSIRCRSGGLVSAAPWCRRLTTPSAWKVTNSGARTALQRASRRPRRHPEVGVDDVRRGQGQVVGQRVGELAHVGPELVLGQRAAAARRSGGPPRSRLPWPRSRAGRGRPGGCRRRLRGRVGSTPSPVRRRGCSGHPHRRLRRRPTGWRVRRPARRAAETRTWSRARGGTTPTL